MGRVHEKDCLWDTREGRDNECVTTTYILSLLSLVDSETWVDTA